MAIDGKAPYYICVKTNGYAGNWERDYMASQKVENERIEEINRVASKDGKTKDPQYNRGLKAIQDHGYEHVIGIPDVEYWCMCNNL